MTEFKHGPYNGYLAQVTQDYFTQGGLRPSHNAVFDGMDPATQQAVQPFMPDLRPMGAATPPLLRELPRATLGAWGNYLGDMYSGKIAPPEVRHDVAVGSTLIMGMLAADETTWRQSPGARNSTDVMLFYASIRDSIKGGPHIMQRETFAHHPHMATQLLAEQVHTRVVAGNEERQTALVEQVHALAGVRREQFANRRGEIGGMLITALNLGEVTARMALGLTTLRPEVKAAPASNEGEAAAMALGKIGAIITHGTGVDAAFRDRMPTYATATVMNEYGPTKAAINSINEHRAEYVDMLVNEGRAALKDGTRQQQGIFRMAVRLLKIRQGQRGIGSTDAIKRYMKEDPYWNRYL